MQFISLLHVFILVYWFHWFLTETPFNRLIISYAALSSTIGPYVLHSPTTQKHVMFRFSFVSQIGGIDSSFCWFGCWVSTASILSAISFKFVYCASGNVGLWIEEKRLFQKRLNDGVPRSYLKFVCRPNLCVKTWKVLRIEVYKVECIICVLCNRPELGCRHRNTWSRCQIISMEYFFTQQRTLKKIFQNPIFYLITKPFLYRIELNIWIENETKQKQQQSAFFIL